MVEYLDYQADNGQQTKVLLLWTRFSLPISRLCTNVLREVCSYLHRRDCILGLLNQRIAIFNIQEHSFRSAALSMRIPETCVYCELTANSIIILGFQNKSVYSLSFPKLNFTPLSETNAKRGRPGAIRCSSFIYAFGGLLHGRLLASSERYNVHEGVWQILPDMPHSVSSFSPVLHERRIYLPSSNCVDSFDIDTLTFTTHCEFTDGNIVSVAAAVDGEIVMLTHAKAFRISIWEEVEVKKVHSLADFSEVMLSRTCPLVIGREVWFVLAREFTAVRYSPYEQKIITVRESEKKEKFPLSSAA